MALIPKITYPKTQIWINPSESYLGTGEPNTTLYVELDGGSPVNTVQIDAGGNWSFQIPTGVFVAALWNSDKTDKVYFINEPTNYVLHYDSSITALQPTAPIAPTTGTTNTAINVNIAIAGTINVYKDGILLTTLTGVVGDNAYTPTVIGNYTFSIVDANGNSSPQSTVLAITAGSVGTCPMPVLNTITQSQAVKIGVSFDISITITGTATKIELYKKGLNSNNLIASSASKNINFSSADAGTYNFIVTNDCGGGMQASGFTSPDIVLTVDATGTLCAKPTITVQPADINVTQGTNLVANVTATADGTLSYVWRMFDVGLSGSSTIISGQNTSQLNIPFSASYDTRGVFCVVTNTCTNGTPNDETTNVASITITPTNTGFNCSTIAHLTALGTWNSAPLEPLVAIKFPNTGTKPFIGQVTSQSPLKFAIRGANMLGRSDITYATGIDATAQSCFDGGITTNGGLDYPTNFPVPPNYELVSGIYQPLANICPTPIAVITGTLAVQIGQTLTLTATITGSYTAIQWKKNGIAISGATGLVFSKTMATGDADTYTVEATNSCSGLTASVGVSAQATVTSPTSGGAMATFIINATITGTGCGSLLYAVSATINNPDLIPVADRKTSNEFVLESGTYYFIVWESGKLTNNFVKQITVTV